MRLLARFARLESRSPVTSFPPEADRPWTETELVIRGDIPTGAGNILRMTSMSQGRLRHTQSLPGSSWPKTLAKLLSDTNWDEDDWGGKAEPEENQVMYKYS